MNSTILIGFGAACVVLLSLVMLLLQALGRQEAHTARVRAMQRNVGLIDETAADGGHASLDMITRFGRALSRSGLLPASTLAELEQTLAAAGYRGANVLSLFVGGKVLLVLLLPTIAYLVLHHMTFQPLTRFILIAGAAMVGLLLPDMVLRRLRQRHLKGVERGLPDALDMLVICSEAGLGLEPAIERVAHEIGAVHPAIALEMQRTSAELRILADRRLALTNMGGRTGLANLKRLGATLIQTMQYGTPLSQALRTLASEMRHEMLMQFEARAARLPVLLTLPMIVFILPCIFLVVGGPAGLMVLKTFSGQH